jgi:tRNA-dihydrouridine synthase B
MDGMPGSHPFGITRRPDEKGFKHGGGRLLIGDVKLPGNIFLAPMAGVTDLPFRLLCKEQGASLVYTEMLSAKAMHYGDEGTFRLSETHPEERPVAAQIFGHEPEIMAEAAAVLSARDDICIIDVNMGCPAPKIIKNGDGACLMQKPALVREIVREIRKASKKPVTVKIRKGWDKSSANTVEIASICEEEGASAVTVHGRTRDQQYSGETDLECIREVKRALRIPVIGNGDIRLPEDARRMFEATGCDAVMIGRGAQGNPWIFNRILSYFKDGIYDIKVSNEERLRMILRHYGLMEEYKGENTAMREMRKHVAWYLRGLPGSARVKTEVFSTNDIDRVKSILKEYLLSLT